MTINISKNSLSFFEHLKELSKERSFKYGYKALSNSERYDLVHLIQAAKTEENLTGQEVVRVKYIFSKLEHYDKSTWAKRNLFVRIFDAICEIFQIGLTRVKILEQIRGAKEVTRSSISQILNNLYDYKLMNPGRVNFLDFLESIGYCSIISNVDFTALAVDLQGTSGLTPGWGSTIFHDIDFSGIVFKKCRMEWISFKNSSFNNVRFDQVNCANAVFDNCFLNEVTFTNSSLSDSTFYQSEIHATSFIKANCSSSSFTECRLAYTNFRNANLFGSQFFLTEAASCSLIRSNLKNCFLFDSKSDWNIKKCTKNVITKPLIALMWNIHKPGNTAYKTYNHLKSNHFIPLRVYYLPEEIHTERLEKEVQVVLKSCNVNADRSIPKQILDQASSDESYREIHRLHIKAKQIIDSVDGVLFPGGDDIQPEFYGQDREELTVVDPDYRRSMLEFSILYEIEKIGMPFLGICRGAQMGNVFKGGDLIQHIEGHKGIGTCRVVAGEEMGIIPQVVGPVFSAMSMHHQAMNKIGEGLQVVMHGKNIPKIVEMKNKKTFFVLSQVHPEFLERLTSINSMKHLFSKFIDLFLSNSNWSIFDAFKSHIFKYRSAKA